MKLREYVKNVGKPGSGWIYGAALFISFAMYFFINYLAGLGK
jgi:hypothetical protein